MLACNNETVVKNFTRAQLLLEPEQHRALTEIAQREGRSMSDVVREMVREQLGQRNYAEKSALARDLTLYGRLRRRREKAVGKGKAPPVLDTVALITQMRDEQDERNATLRRD